MLLRHRRPQTRRRAGPLPGSPFPVPALSLLDIHVLGSPILRQETTPVERMTSELRRLTDDMLDTMHAAKGIGLAAPQIGRSERIAVVDIGAFER